MDYIFLTKEYTESNDTSSTDGRYTFGNNILNKQYFEFSQKLHSILRLKIKLILKNQEFIFSIKMDLYSEMKMHSIFSKIRQIPLI